MKAVMKEVTHEVGGPAMRLISRTSIPFGFMWLQITQSRAQLDYRHSAFCWISMRCGGRDSRVDILKITCHLSETLTPENMEVSWPRKIAIN